MSYRNRLKYANFPALFLNCLMLVLPVVLIVLVRGWFFASAWRRRRFRNTVAIVLMGAMVLSSAPFGAAVAADYPSAMEQFLYDHLKERLALMYGGEENIPPLDPGVTAGYLPYTVPAGEDTILRDAALYFLPDGVRDDAARAWTRAAKALAPDPVRTASNDSEARATSVATASDVGAQHAVPIDKSLTADKW